MTARRRTQKKDKISIKKEELRQAPRSGVKPSKVHADKSKYRRRSKHVKKSSDSTS